MFNTYLLDEPEPFLCFVHDGARGDRVALGEGGGGREGLDRAPGGWKNFPEVSLPVFSFPTLLCHPWEATRGTELHSPGQAALQVLRLPGAAAGTRVVWEREGQEQGGRLSAAGRQVPGF